MTDAAARFAACLAETLKHEGAWSDDPYDPGGPTMKGITIRVYAGYLGVKLTKANYEDTKERLRNITDAEIDAIYRKNYWAPARGDELPAGVDFEVWDFCVNSGAGQAIKSLQRVLGVTVDGHLGAATMGALQRHTPADLIHKYMDERRRFYRSLPTFWRFGKGWLKRADEVEATAQAMAAATYYPLKRGEDRGEGDGVTAPVVAPPTPNPTPQGGGEVYPLPDADAQSATQGRAVAPDPKPPIATEITLALSGIMSNVGGFANGFGKLASMQAPTWHSIALAFLSEPLVLTGLVMVFSAVATFLWRRQHA